MGREIFEGVTVYREWPGGYEIPGCGVPGPWARRSSRNRGVNDGEADEGQTKLDFGLLRYKFEIARLERWADYERWAACGDGVQMDGGWLYPYEDELRAWNEGNGSRDDVALRIVDSRAAMHSKIGMREDKSFIDLLNELGMNWVPASGERVGTGEERITDALEWRRDGDGTLAKAPRLWFATECANHIWAMENYLGADGQKGACKEPVDCLRYLYMSGMAEPPPGKCWNVLVLDPAPERKWFMGWYRCAGAGSAEVLKCESAGVVRGTGMNAERRTPNAQLRRETGPRGDERRVSMGVRRW
jgi:hypothetical protein